MKKVLFIASLPTKKRHFDGERNKSKVVLDCLKTIFDRVDVINYSYNKYFQTLKLLFKSVFVKYDYIFISKCIVGGSYANHLIQKLANKHNKKNVVFYVIGNGFFGFENKNLYFDDMKKCKKLIVESPLVVDSFKSAGLENCVVFPCIKHRYNVVTNNKNYHSEDPLRVIFFSRITNTKGLSDAIDAISIVNSKGTTKFVLDIAGGISKHEVEYAKQVEEQCNNSEYLNYLGENFFIKGEESYKTLSEYDLHIFPSKFFQECVPGSIIDMFIAGVPTISSLFANAKNIMSNDDSYFFEVGNVDSLVKELESIWNNKKLLEQKRILTKQKAEEYYPESFIKFLKEKCFK